MSSVTRYGAATTVLILNNKKFSDFSKDDEPIKLETMEDLRDLELHHGGGAVIIDRINEGGKLTLSLQPGTDDSGYCSGLYSSGEMVEGELLTMGTGEKILVSGGVCTKFGDVGRGFKPSNDNYEFKFTKVVPIMGSK